MRHASAIVPARNPKRNRPDLTGQVFGRLTVIGKLSAEFRNAHRDCKWLCKCECGKEHAANTYCLVHSRVRSCGCLYRDTRRTAVHKNPFHLPSGKSLANRRFYRYKTDAAAKGLGWNLDRKEFDAIITKDCFYCGASPSKITHKMCYGHLMANGIDRVDNSKGYELANVVPCCHTCNHAKCAMSQQEFISWIRRTFHHLENEKLISVPL